MLMVTVMYANGDDATFDHDYYRSHHMPLVQRTWKPMGLSDARVMRGVPGPDGKGPPFLVMTHMTFPDMAAFAAASEKGAEIFKDIRNFTNVRPQTQVSEDDVAGAGT